MLMLMNNKVVIIGKVTGKRQSGDWVKHLREVAIISKVTGIDKVIGKHQSGNWEEYLSKVTGIGKVTGNINQAIVKNISVRLLASVRLPETSIRGLEIISQ